MDIYVETQFGPVAINDVDADWHVAALVAETVARAGVTMAVAPMDLRDYSLVDAAGDWVKPEYTVAEAGLEHDDTLTLNVDPVGGAI